ncbi:MAG: hypothetical protein DMD38_08010 [Gemmatimonadetes bacterium]|nr:MAG: hypothetical protein AUI86_10370 [Gemmatimonadetes bacterium 13_1_40CM_3_66_12]OLD85018.1 MAG: hypothetical protein AUG85_14835 [Gemmatimonadetes bacterium 13_1_20CM_4_66_11]PYP96545.1 MAG: hypothetical protein DMD38_08010 [Gemmatimonadota bacterium]
MAAALPLKRPVKVGELVRRRLRELKRTPRELADAVQVSEIYIADLVAGRRRPPAPGRMDVYAPMTKFLKLHRNDLPTCAKAERDGETKSKRRPHPEIRDQFLALCLDPARARVLARRLGRKDGVTLERVIVGRLLEVAQGFVRRQLDDDVGIRIAASREGCTYLEWRMKLMEFLDATPEGLTPDDGAEFVRPRIAGWDIDLDTHAMRIVLRSQDPAPRQVRALSI